MVEQTQSQEARIRLANLFRVFLTLGFTSFGGPVAHIGFFREAFVVQRKWIDDRRFSDLLSLCQFIPGPASSQLGMAIGYHHAGYSGAMLGWLGFTLPSAIFLGIFAAIVAGQPTWVSGGFIQGLKLVAVAVVIQAFIGMRASLAPDKVRISIMTLSMCVFLFWQSVYAPLVVLTIVGVTCCSFKAAADSGQSSKPVIPPFFKLPALFICTFVLLLMVSLLVKATVGGHMPVVDQFGAYFLSGALVFGGGHVVLPLLETSVVQSGWVDKDIFLAGYGAAQAVPGPLFTFSSFLGASHEVGATGLSGWLIATCAIFLPSFLLLFGVLPYWELLRERQGVKSALWGVNAAVLGLLLATIYDPIITSSINTPKDIVLAVVAFVALYVWKIPVVAVVLAGATAGILLY